jgi:hypothetical protein
VPFPQRHSSSDSRSHPRAPAQAPPSWPWQWRLPGGCAAFWQGEEGGEDEEVSAGLGPGLLPVSLLPGVVSSRDLTGVSVGAARGEGVAQVTPPSHLGVAGAGL